jgi:ABC transporter substrate binding protein
MSDLKNKRKEEPPASGALKSALRRPARAELVWEGKYDAAGRRVAPLRVALPFQTVETVNESTQDRQRGFQFGSGFREEAWRNRLIWGDKKYVLPSLLPEFAGKVNLIYIDPPFDTGADFSFTATVPDDPESEEDDSFTFTKEPTSTMPLVMIAVGDPVGTGVVPSLARPGGNITGLSSIAPDLEGKRLELLREVIPKLSHVVLFLNPLNPFHTVSMRHALTAAQALGLKLQPLEVRTSGELDGAFAAILREKPDALLILADRVFLHDRKRMMDFATEHRLPSVNAYRELVEAGGLMSYGPSYEDMHRRAADYVDKILKGAKPGDLPVEQPTKFTLILNLKAARTLGIDVPPMLLARADEVIE